MQLIGLAGYAGAGKDTAADYLLEHFTGYRRAFADPLRRAAAEVFGLTHEQMTDRVLKEQEVPYWGKSPRQLLQLLGTEGVRDVFGPDTWCKRAALEVEAVRELDSHEPFASDFLIFTDVRFADEAHWIRQQGGTVVQVVRTGIGPVNSHSSDQGLPDQLTDLVLENNGDLHRLSHQVYALGMALLTDGGRAA